MRRLFSQKNKDSGRGPGAAAALLPALLILGMTAGVPAPILSAQADAAASDPSQAPQAAPGVVPTQVDPLSPRAALQDYLELCRTGRFARAAEYLDLSGPAAGLNGPLTARRLKAVLDQHIWFDMERVSPRAEGEPDDGLGPGRERLGRIPGAEGRGDPVLMVRTASGGPPGWRFAPETLARVDTWYGQLGSHWLRDRVPSILLRLGPLELQWWQWLAVPLLALAIWLLARMVGWAAYPLAQRLTRRSATEFDDILVVRLTGPALLFMGLGLFRGGLAFLDLTVPAEALLDRLLRALILVAIFWGLSHLVDVAVMGVNRSHWMVDKQEIQALLPFATRVGRIVVLALGVVTVLQEFGFTVTGLLAGMGLAGMAAALAGQKSIENLLGSATILADRPFRVGDFVRIEDLVGTVEEVGLRSTRLRTLDRTLVTLPNGRLSEMRLETFAARDRIRLLAVLGLTYDTPAETLRRVIAELERVLAEHPRVCEEPRRVRFVEFADFALKIEVFAYLQTTDWAEFLTLRQEIFLRFMDIVEAAGSSFAFPTRTVHLEPAEITLKGAPVPASQGP